MTKTSTIALTSALLCSLFLGAAANANTLDAEQRNAVERHFELLEQAQAKTDQDFADKIFIKMDKNLQRQESAMVADICTEHGGEYDNATGTCTGIK